MKNQSGISTLAVVIIIVLIILTAVVTLFVFGNLNKGGDQGGEVKVKENKKAAAEWSVYRNDQFGFEFKFPASASVDDAYLANQYAFSVAATSKDWGGGVVAVINHGNVGTMTLSEFVAKNLKAQGDSGATVKETKFNGYDSVSAKGKKKTSYYLLRKLDVYEVYKTSGVPTSEADKMFASFKFIEQ